LVEKATEVEKTYEFFFNMSQVLMKKQLQEEAFRCLVQAYTLAKQDEESVLHGDLTRFKIQELHALNTFSQEFSAIEYNAGGAEAGARFNLPKSLKHDNLVEINMSALSQNEQYSEGLDKKHIKEVIGNLNWNKFSERISQ
jgi:hypothetical protein